MHHGAETLYTDGNNGNFNTRTVGDYAVDYDRENDGENGFPKLGEGLLASLLPGLAAGAGG